MEQQRHKPQPGSRKPPPRPQPQPQPQHEQPEKPTTPQAKGTSAKQYGIRRPYDKHAWLKQNTGVEIENIKKDALLPDPTPVNSASGFDILCSYNWHKESHPSIYVPGAPPKWTPQSLPITLPPDKAGSYIDQNAHRVPNYPFEPLFRAMTVMKPEFDFSQVDFIANRNSMRKLLNFASGQVFEPFRIDLNMVHDTLFFTRRERRTRESATGPYTNAGFGHSFENQFTVPQPGLEDSTSHHRVARYKFGDLNGVIRYEVDAWLPVEDVRDDHEDAVGTATKPNQDDEDLLASLQKLSLTKQEKTLEDGAKQGKAKQRGTQVVTRGSAVDPTRLAELKCKAKNSRKRDLVSQLWFGRIPYLALSLHDKGTVERVAVTSTVKDFETFETQQQDHLRKVVHLIKLLKKVTMASTDKACVVLCDHKIKPLRLTLYTSTQVKSVLPADLIKDYWTEKAA